MRFIIGLCSFSFWGLIFGLIILGAILFEFSKDLPPHAKLADYEPPTATRVHAADGRIMGEFAIERRVFVPYEVIPEKVIHAFISAEDKTFFLHHGLDFKGIARAVITNVRNLAAGRRPVGASTITQQVAKNMLLSAEVSFDRKIKEAILAVRIDQALSKERILELYLNEIYLGFQSYGVAAAALNYFNKSLDELTLAEAAYLATLPKAPNNYHPIRFKEAAIGRRNWVLGRMQEDGYITTEQAAEAALAPLEVHEREATEVARADYFLEEVRRELIALDQFGEDKLYKGGLSVRTTLDPRLQGIARDAMRWGLMQYDRRHGWRGPVTHLDSVDGDWVSRLAQVEAPPGSENWKLALVLSTNEPDTAVVGLVGGETGVLPLDAVTWARRQLDKGGLGPAIKSVRDVLTPGDVVLVESDAFVAGADGKATPTFTLQQIPEVSGGFIALDPHTGRVLAMVGGFSYAMSEFNRATQALRQPGSAFKPFVYLTALQNGMTPADTILDAPIELDPGAGQKIWRPANYSHRYYGETTLRVGLERSRNLMTVRLARLVGMDKIAPVAESFGIVDHLSPVLAMSLGSGETTVLRLTAAYGMLVNGGKRIRPTLIDRIQDHNGHTVYRHDTRLCPDCRDVEWHEDIPVPRLQDAREQLIDPRHAYQIVSMLEGVVRRGTGVVIASLGRPLAGKTGTTNDYRDAWFVGFSPDLAVGLYVGFDEPHNLGSRESGGRVAAPIFKRFMGGALEGTAPKPFRVPSGIQFVWVDRESGQLASAGDSGVIREAFIPGTAPTSRVAAADGSGNGNGAAGTDTGDVINLGTGGLY